MKWIGADDIVLTPSVFCQTIPTSAAQPTYSTTTTTTTTLSTLPSIDSLSCSFENSCRWNNDGATFDWIVISASTAYSQFNGPNFDHTLNSDKGFMLTPNVTQDLSAYSTASYNSPLVNGTKCVEFFYYMLGPQVILITFLFVILVFNFVYKIRLEPYLYLSNQVLQLPKVIDCGHVKVHLSHNGDLDPQLISLLI